MTNFSLARSYLVKARTRLEMLDWLAGRQAWSDVVREAQEAVELALKALLRSSGVEPPKWHDVGGLLAECAGQLPEGIRGDIPRLAEISRALRKDRELAFYGDVDFIPTEAFTEAEARNAIAGARFVVETVGKFQV